MLETPHSSGCALFCHLLPELLPVCRVVESAHDKSELIVVAIESPHRVGDFSGAGVAFLAAAVAQVYAIVSAPVAERGSDKPAVAR